MSPMFQRASEPGELQHRSRLRSGATALLLAIALPAFGAEPDWPRFRGPNGSGLALAATPPATWSDTQNLKWKLELPGPGTSSPILVGERVFLTCWTGHGATKNKSTLTRELLCVDRATGKLRWAKSISGESPPDHFEGYLPEHGYASHTPVSTGCGISSFGPSLSGSAAIAIPDNRPIAARPNASRLIPTLRSIVIPSRSSP